jgi:adenosylcobinamide kinase/adenosylcobinamide-phosphate guanylyltransferase
VSSPLPLGRRVLVLGGARSGKSAHAESLLASAESVDYLAAAGVPDDDPEWAARVAVHKLRRPASWRTVETADLAAELATDGSPALLDSVTSWLTRAMDDCDSWSASNDDAALSAAIERFVAAWEASPRQVVAVSDEVGSGVVPETASGRLFRDTLGTLNQRLAATAEEVYLVVAGLPQRLK